MLVTNKYAKDDIVSFKLVNGDEIVAKIVEEGDDGFVISKPCTVMPSQKGIGLIQSIFTSDLDKNINLDKKHVMMHAGSLKDIETHYIKTTTGLDIIEKGKIIT
jgi:hypothetical protein